MAPGDIGSLSTEELHAELVSLEMRRWDVSAELVRRLCAVHVEQPVQEPLLTAQELAMRLSGREGKPLTVRALRQRLARPRWAWLRELGEEA